MTAMFTGRCSGQSVTHLVTHLVRPRQQEYPPGGPGLSRLIHEKPILVSLNFSNLPLNALMLDASTDQTDERRLPEQSHRKPQQ